MGHKYIKEEDTFSTSQNGTVPKPTAQEVSDGKFLKADGTWAVGGGGGSVSGVKGDAESTYRTGNVNITPANLGLGTAATKNSTNQVTNGSQELVESGAVYTALTGKSDTLNLAYVESGSTATKTGGYVKNDLFVLGGKLCRATATIAQGATFTLNTNYVETNISKEIIKVTSKVYPSINASATYAFVDYPDEVKNHTVYSILFGTFGTAGEPPYGISTYSATQFLIYTRSGMTYTNCTIYFVYV